MAALIRPLLRRFVRSESGAELIEFALTLPLLLLLVLGMIEFGFLFQQYEVVTNAAREGARIAVLPAYSATAAAQVANAQARAEQYLAAGGLTDAHPAPVVTPIAPVAPACVSMVSVLVTYPHPIAFVGGVLSYFGKSIGTAGVITLKATSTMRNETAAACP